MKFNLSKKREQFFNEMSNHTPELAWAFQFVENEIKRQDKEFIKRLKQDLSNPRMFDDAPIAVAENVAEKINNLVGDKLI